MLTETPYDSPSSPSFQESPGGLRLVVAGDGRHALVVAGTVGSAHGLLHAKTRDAPYVPRDVFRKAGEYW
jgi:hypothetical protein